MLRKVLPLVVMGMGAHGYDKKHVERKWLRKSLRKSYKKLKRNVLNVLVVVVLIVRGKDIMASETDLISLIANRLRPLEGNRASKNIKDKNKDS